MNSIEEWAAIFKQPETLAKTVTKHWLFKGVEIKKEIDQQKTDFAAKNYFDAGTDAAGVLTDLIGPVPVASGLSKEDFCELFESDSNSDSDSDTSSDSSGDSDSDSEPDDDFDGDRRPHSRGRRGSGGKGRRGRGGKGRGVKDRPDGTDSDATRPDGPHGKDGRPIRIPQGRPERPEHHSNKYEQEQLNGIEGTKNKMMFDFHL